MRVLNVLWKVVVACCLLVTAGSLTFIALRVTTPLLQAGSAANDPNAKPGAAVDGLLTGLAGAMDQVGGVPAGSSNLNPVQQGAQKLRSLQEQIGAQRGFDQLTNSLDSALGQGSGRGTARSGPARVQGGEPNKVGETATEAAEAAAAGNLEDTDPAAVLGKGQLGELVRKLGGGDVKLDGLGNLESQLGSLGGLFGGAGGLGGGALDTDGPSLPAGTPAAPEVKTVKRSIAAGELKHIDRPEKAATGAKRTPVRVE